MDPQANQYQLVEASSISLAPAVPLSRFVENSLISLPLLSHSNPLRWALNRARFYPVQDCILKTEHRFVAITFFKGLFRACIVGNCQLYIVNCQLFRSSPRHISIGQLHTLPCFHPRPINVIVYDVPYSFRMGDLILGRVSRLDAFSVYLVQT